MIPNKIDIEGLNELIDDFYDSNTNEGLIVRRVIDRIIDSESFTSLVRDRVSNSPLRIKRININTESLLRGEVIDLSFNQWYLVPSKYSGNVFNPDRASWSVKDLSGEVIVDRLNKGVSLSILSDINTIFAIKASRERRDRDQDVSREITSRIRTL